jgi:hypothetical protein
MDPTVNADAIERLLALLEPESYGALPKEMTQNIIAGGRGFSAEGGLNMEFQIDADKVKEALAVLVAFKSVIEWVWTWLKGKAKPKRNVRKELLKKFGADPAIRRFLNSKPGMILIAYWQGMEDSDH